MLLEDNISPLETDCRLVKNSLALWFVVLYSLNMSKRYTKAKKQALIAQVLALLPTMSVTAACEEAGLPLSTWSFWVESFGISEEYSRARTLYHEKLAQEILSIADEEIEKDNFGKTDSGKVQQNKLRLHARQWYLSKLQPKKYGDRLQLAGDEESPVVIKKIERVILDQPGRKDDNG